MDLAVNIQPMDGLSLIRGYSQVDLIPFAFSLTNIDEEDDIVKVPYTRRNFNISVGVFKDTTMENSKHVLWFVENIQDSQLQYLYRGDSISLSDSFEVVIPRSTCEDYNYICVAAEPGHGSSFSKGELLAPNTSNCFNLSSVLDCKGILLCIILFVVNWLYYAP